jgi:hypothetical protein
MNPKQLKRIAIALVVLLFFWGMSEILGGKRDDTEVGVVLPALDASEFDGVTFATDSGTTVLTRTVDNSWMVNGFETDQGALDELFEAVGESVELELVATSALVHERMGVDSVSGIRVSFVRGNETVAAAIFGKSGSEYGSRYARSAAANFVYLYTGALANLVTRPVSGWRDKRIIDISADSVFRVTVERSGEQYSLVRTGAEWQFETGSPADSGAMHRMLGRFQTLDASSFPEEAQLDSIDFDPPDRQVTLFNSSGDTLISLMFDSTNAAYWVQQASGGYIYRILAWQADQMVPADSTVRAGAEGTGNE